MSLRPYQQRIVDDAMNEYTNYTRPFVVDAFQACLAGDTKVLTPDGYQAIKDLHEGDIVGSWNGDTVEWNEIECRSITRSSHSPKPMLELEYEDYDTTGKKIKRHCKTTYDHRFFDGAKYYPLYQLVWRDMEESQRVQLEILCKQYGQDFDYTIQRGISCWDNPASEGCQRLSQDSIGQEDGESSSSYSSDVHPKSPKQTDREPYQWGQDGQSNSKPRMGNQRGTDTACIGYGVMDEGKIRRHEGGASITTRNDGRTTSLVMEGMGKQGSRSNAKAEDRSIQRIVNGEQRPVQPSDTCATEECHPQPYKLSAIRVCEAEDYYAITVKHCHSYIIEGGFPTHNSGKSWMIAEIAKRVGKCLILCMNKELVEQDAEKIRAVGAECSIYSASCGEKVISNITVATIGSIYKHPEYCQHFNLVIVDEADQVPVDKKDSMYMKLFRQIKKPVMGWTGTAFRTAYNYSRLKNGDVVQSTVIKSLDKFNFWGKVVGGVTYQELLDEEFVSPIQYYVEDTNMSMLRVNSTGLDYTEDSLEKYGGANRMRLVQVVRGAVDTWKCKRVLVAVPNIEEAERVAEILRADGVRAESLHSQMSKKERTRIVEHFKEGTIQVVVQVLILNVGFDLPALDCVIFARPSLSLRIWCQFVARGIRLDPDDKTKTCKCIDMGGMIKLYGRIEDVKVKGGNVIGTHGYISDKVLNKVNVSEMARRFN